MKFSNKVHHIHFVGIAGIGMSGIAEVLLNLGFHISGSDLLENDLTKKLSAFGARIYLGHRAKNIDGAQVIVKTSAANDDNIEITTARLHSIPVISRAEMLAELMRLKFGIAIGGMHGKTTTTSMTASILSSANLDPTMVIGGKLKSIGSNARLGNGDYFVAEADESDGSFLLLSPIISVITNIDYEHLDYYKLGIEEIKSAFLKFINKVPFYGLSVLCFDDSHIQSFLNQPFQITRRYVTYGLNAQSQYSAENIRVIENQTHYTFMHHQKPQCEIILNMLGIHNVQNSLAAIAVARELEIDYHSIQKALISYSGVGRRFEIKTSNEYVTIIDDYGHHPNEIKATLKTAKQLSKNRIITIFQPHRYSRLQMLFQEFVQAFDDSDLLILTKLYSAGESPLPVSSETLAREIEKKNRPKVIYLETPSQVIEFLRQQKFHNDILLFLGAGDITKLCDTAVKELTSHEH